MSNAGTVFYLIGAVVTLAAFVMLFAKRYPGRSGRLGLGIAIGIAVMLLWPVAIWVASALWLTGFARPPVPEDPDLQEPPGGLSRKVAIPLCAVGALITFIVIGATAGPATEPGSAVAAESGTTTVVPPGDAAASTVVEVVDGDTIKVDDGRTVRIIGIDAPETVAPGEPVECWGPEAAAFARQTLLDQEVTLVEDPTQDPVDRYGRTLAAVMLPDGQDFSVLAAEAGHVRAYLFETPSQRYDAISAAESRARAAGLGLWGPACAAPPSAEPQPTTPPRPVPPTTQTPPPAVPSSPQPQPAVQVPRTATPQPEPPPTSRPDPEPAPAPPPQPTATSGPQPAVYYQNCTEARDAGAAPLYAGEPGYRSGLDRDGDGVACEN